jgi:hypothetical protein
MSIRFSHLAMVGLVVAFILMTTRQSRAVYYELGQSKDQWGMKYDVAVNDTGRDTATVVFTVADEGRLKPFLLIELIAYNPQVDSQGGHGYDVKAPIELKPTKDGRLVGEVQIKKEFLNRAQIRILTHMVDGRPQMSGSACYLVPIKKYLDGAPSAPAPIALPPGSRITK